MKYRHSLPQIDGAPTITDGGLETVLIFKQGHDLPAFAAFPLLESAEGRQTLRDYFDIYADIAHRHETGLVLETPTWRANADWGHQIGFDRAALDAINVRAVAEMERFRADHETGSNPMPISGCIGPRGDGYVPNTAMTPEQAEAYHLPQIRTFAGTAADLVSGYTINYANEAIGIVRAAQRSGIPAVVSFTVETDGRLPDGEELGAAIERCDRETDGYAAYYMINCAHPTHFADTLADGGRWRERLVGIRANASRLSHAELEQLEELDEGNPDELGGELDAVRAACPSLNVFGGCCGTDESHIEAIAREVTKLAAVAG